MGKPIDFIHGVVPGLNPAVGMHIQGFLRKLKPGIAWLRHNWGLSRSPEFNQHPTRSLPRLTSDLASNEVYLRIEHQALVALPPNGVLFGIRITVHPLSEVLAEPAAAAGLARALRTMTEAMAQYKGLAVARVRLLAMLEG